MVDFKVTVVPNCTHASPSIEKTFFYRTPNILFNSCKPYLGIGVRKVLTFTMKTLTVSVVCACAELGKIFGRGRIELGELSWTV